MADEVFEHWKNVNDKEVIEKAEKNLNSEIESGLLNSIEHHAERYLLKMKLGLH
jgi:hypothetical protein